MASYCDARNRAKELTETSLVEIAEIIIDLETENEGLKDEVSDLEKQLEAASKLDIQL